MLYYKEYAEREGKRMYDIPAEARAAGFSTIQWLRAMTFVEHTIRIEHSTTYPSADRPAPAEARKMGLEAYLKPRGTENET